MSTGAIRTEIDRVEALANGGGTAVDATARADATAGQTYLLSIPIDLALIVGDGDVVTDLVLGHKFQLVGKPRFVVTEVGTGVAKTVDFVLDIGATPVTGGSVTVTTALTAALGGVIAAAAAISAANAGIATDAISVRSANTTAFTSGKGILILTIKSVA